MTAYLLVSHTQRECHTDQHRPTQMPWVLTHNDSAIVLIADHTNILDYMYACKHPCFGFQGVCLCYSKSIQFNVISAFISVQGIREYTQGTVYSGGLWLGT